MEAPLKPLDPEHQDRVVRELLVGRDHQTILLVKPGEIPASLAPLVETRVARRFVGRRPVEHREVSELVLAGALP
jgi:hypothetical protein